MRKSALLAGSVALNRVSVLAQSANLKLDGDRLVLLGTQGGPFIRSFKQTPSANLIVYKNTPMVIDTGFGVTFKLLESGVRLASLKYIFISHHHSDHNLELGPLLYNAWLAGLASAIHVYAPIGLNALLTAYWESNRYDIETRIKDEGRPDVRSLIVAHEYSAGTVLATPDFEVRSLKNMHPPVEESYALRFQLGERVIIFSGDTAYFPPLAAFASDADYLVHEVMNGPAVEEMVKRRPNATRLKASILSHHTLAEDVGKIAQTARAKTLVLTHFVPPDDKSLTDEVWIKAVATNYSGKIIVGKDLLEIAL